MVCPLHFSVISLSFTVDSEEQCVGFHICKNLNVLIQVNLAMTDSMGPGKWVRHMHNPSYTYDKCLICIELGPRMLSVICKNPSYSGPSYPSSPVFSQSDPINNLEPIMNYLKVHKHELFFHLLVTKMS